MRALHLTSSIAVFGACAALLMTPAVAQAADATLTGTVTDASTGKALKDATVIVTSPALQGSKQSRTDASGRYRISQLPVGTYNILFAKGGYKRMKHVDVRLRSGQTGQLNASLPPLPRAPAEGQASPQP